MTIMWLHAAKQPTPSANTLDCRLGNRIAENPKQSKAFYGITPQPIKTVLLHLIITLLEK